MTSIRIAFAAALAIAALFAGAHDELLDRDGPYAAMWAAFTGEAELVA